MAPSTDLEHEPRYRTPVPSPELVEGAWYDEEAVERVLEALRAMPHTKTSAWAGKPFEPEPWQLEYIIGPIFGWKHADGTRIIREAWVEIPRKNGKSALASRLGLVLLAADREPGAEVYAAATSREQAGVVFEEAKTVAERLPAGIVDAQRTVIRGTRSGGIFRVLSRIKEAAHGLNVHGALIDEIHVHKNRGLIDAITTGTGARSQPLVFYITTADDGDDETIYGEKHGYTIKLARGEAVDPTFYGVVWAADPKDDPYLESTWRKANPNLEVSIGLAYIRKEAEKARETPSYLPTFRRLHLNVRTQIEAAPFVPIDIWKQTTAIVDEPALKGRQCWGGLVAASAQDVTSICWSFPMPDGGVESLWRFYLPEELVGHLDGRTDGRASSEWSRRGGPLRLTDGNVIDIGAHEQQIREDCKRFDVQELAYDVNGAIGIVQPLMESNAVTCVPIYANTPGSALIDWERLIRSGQYRHGGNPIIAWQFGALMVRESTGGILRIDRKGSLERVDGTVAAELALRRLLLGQTARRTGQLTSF